MSRLAVGVGVDVATDDGGAMAQTLPGPGTSSRGRWSDGLREVLLVAVLFFVYKAVRQLGAEQSHPAFVNARRVLDLERWLHLPSELTLQRGLLNHDALLRSADSYYKWVHFPVTVAMLVVLWWRARALYGPIRRVLTVLTLGALVIHLAIPLAPPRMMPGFVDTAAVHHQSVYTGSRAASLANQYAAMPSLHVGWAVVVAVAGILALRTPWRWVGLGHPVVTLAVVVVTANHYWVDAIVAAALTAAAFMLVGPRLAAPRGGSAALPDSDRPIALEGNVRVVGAEHEELRLRER